MGVLAHSEGADREALSYLRQALDLTTAVGDIGHRKQVLQSLEICYGALGMRDSAMSCGKEILLLNDSLYRQENVENLKRAEHLATINKYEERMEAEADKHKLRLTLVLIIGGALLIIAVLSIFLLTLSKRRAESDRNLKEANNERLMLLNKQYSMEIEAKAKELTSNTLLLAQKNAKLKELGAQIRNMEKKGEIGETDGKLLSDKINRELSADDDWRYFKLRFEKVHPYFFMSLKETYPDLSKTELRLCAYIRAGMSAKEIAQVLSVRPETVNTSRYRIRKKMGLTSADSIEAILEHF